MNKGHKWEGGHLFTIIMKASYHSIWINLCRIMPIITCIRGHSNKCWSESPVEAQEAPFLYEKNIQIRLYKVKMLKKIYNGNQTKGSMFLYTHLKVDGVEGVGNSSVAMLSFHLEGQPGSNHVQGVGAYHRRHP